MRCFIHYPGQAPVEVNFVPTPISREHDPSTPLFDNSFTIAHQELKPPFTVSDLSCRRYIELDGQLFPESLSNRWENLFGYDDSNYFNELSLVFDNEPSGRIKPLLDAIKTVEFFRTDNSVGLEVDYLTFTYAKLLEANASDEMLEIFAEGFSYLSAYELPYESFTLGFLDLNDRDLDEETVALYAIASTEIFFKNNNASDFPIVFIGLIKRGANFNKLADFSLAANAVAENGGDLKSFFEAALEVSHLRDNRFKDFCGTASKRFSVFEEELVEIAP